MHTAVIKIGGLVAQNSQVLYQLLLEMKQLSSAWRFALVHGGGKEVTKISEQFGLKAEFREGVRLTTAAEMEVVDMVLGGKLNIDLVRRAQTAGLNAVGLGGQDAGGFTGEVRAFEGRPDNRTGTITRIDPQLWILLWGEGYLPILHSTSCDAAGQGLNINADEAALEVSVGLKTDRLIYISDIPGVLNAGQVLPLLTQDLIESHIQGEVITGGMIPKVRSALDGLKRGIGAVVIGGYGKSGDLQSLVSGQSGTTIKLK